MQNIYTKELFKLLMISAIHRVDCDGNRTNQSFFKKFQIVEDKPWLSIDGVYLIYDYVHLLKNIRNLWLTKKTMQLEFEFEGGKFKADFQYLRDLFHSETEQF